MPDGLQAAQRAFAAYIRDPQQAPPPGIERRRIDMYRELFFNNIDGFLSGGFPVLRRILDDAQWQGLVQDFFANHACTTPYFNEIAEEFLTYLHAGPQLLAAYPACVYELAHYEWVELALSIANEEAAGEPLAEPTDSDQPLALSPLAWPLAYRFPVHRISPDYLPTSAPQQATYLVVFRDRHDNVRFLEIGAMGYGLLQLIQANPGQSVDQYMALLASQTGCATEGAAEMLAQLQGLGVVVPAPITPPTGQPCTLA